MGVQLLHGGTRHVNPQRTRWSQVTHYYFRGCAYYTPLDSDPIYGSILFRKLVDVGGGEEIYNDYCGYHIPAEVISENLLGARQYNVGMDLPEGFSAETYLALNPDVENAGVDAATHYLVFGHKEGRSWRP